ncbi:MAG TPA: cytochrome c [Thermodesulfobacteriota bacterium]
MKKATAAALAAVLVGGAASAAFAQQNPQKPTPQSIAAGKALFEQNCATCHGVGGKGDGPAAVALNPKPANFTTGQFKHGGSDAQIFKTISNGVPGTAMVGWSSIPEKSRWDLVNYIRSLGPKK